MTVGAATVPRDLRALMAKLVAAAVAKLGCQTPGVYLATSIPDTETQNTPEVKNTPSSALAPDVKVGAAAVPSAKAALSPTVKRLEASS